MAAMSDYLENELLDHALGTGSFTAPSAVYLKLHIGTPGDDGTTNAAAETTRKVFTCSAASAGTTDNDAALTWTNVSTTEDYSHVSVWDTVGPTGGNCLFVGALDSTVSVTAGDNFEIAAGDLDFTFQ